MSNYRGNPDIIKYGKNTRFGMPRGAVPSVTGSASKLPYHSLRSELRYLLGQRIDLDEDKLDTELERLKKTGNGKTTMLRLLAIAMLEDVLKNGNMRMLQIIVDMTDGKLKEGGSVCF